MTFKYAGKSVVIINKDGTVLETDVLNVEFATLADFTDWANGYDLSDIIRIMILDPRKNKPYDSAQTVQDVTDDVMNQWLSELDVIDHDERFGRPAYFSAKAWDAILEEEADEAASWRNGPAEVYGAPARL